MTHVVEQFPTGNVVVDSEGDVRTPDDFQDADGAFIELPDRPVLEINTPVVEESATPHPEAVYYDDQLEKEADKLGSYPLARAALARRGITDPTDRIQAEINHNGAEAIRQIRRDQELARIDAIFDPEEREKALTVFLAKERAHNDRRSDPAGPVNYRKH